MKKKHESKFKAIGKSIQEYRVNNSLSQEELAEKIGISKSYLSKIEAPNCSKSFSLDVIFDICEVLKITPTLLLKNINEGET